MGRRVCKEGDILKRHTVKPIKYTVGGQRKKQGEKERMVQ